MNTHLKNLKLVFGNPRYAALAIILASLLLILAIWLPNLGFIWSVVISAKFSLMEKFNILFSSLGAIKTNFDFFTRWTTIIISILTGANITLLTFYLKKRFVLEASTGTGILGTLAGLVGIGCASCGSIILSSIFGVTAVSGFIGFLPLDGAEFGIVGILLLLFANYLILKKIDKPLVCKV